MSNTGKISFYLFIILLCIACYHDLDLKQTNETSSHEEATYHQYEYNQEKFQVVSVQVNRSDHFLIIMEKINPDPITNIEQSINDFKSLNPSADIYHLENERIYLFPIYH